MPTEEIVHIFNELRQDIVLLYELKIALANCDYELETLRHRQDTLTTDTKDMVRAFQDSHYYWY